MVEIFMQIILAILSIAFVLYIIYKLQDCVNTLKKRDKENGKHRQ